MGGAVAVDAVELAAAREAPSLRRHAHLGSEALPAFAAAALQDRAAAAGAHPRPEAVGLGPLPLLRLVGALHWPSQYTDATPEVAPRNLFSGICDAARIAARQARRYGRSAGARRLRSTETSTPSGEDVQRARCGPPFPSRPSSSGWSRCGPSGREGDDPLPHRARGDPRLGRAPLLVADREALAGAGAALSEVSFADARRAATRRPAATDGVELNPNYTFERFVIGEGNRLAHAAALAVAEAPSEAYNPLFLHGPPGLGKTHLLVAIANYLRANAPGLSVRYTTAECFTNEFVAALRSERRRGASRAATATSTCCSSTTSSSSRASRTPRRSSSTPSTPSMRAAASSSSPPTASRASSRPSRRGCATASSGA